MSKTTVQLKTHRYEFSEYAMMQLNYFTQVHKYDERKVFKEAWKKWIATDDIAQMIATEKTRLLSEGFDGDVEDKMFKAVRYYFRKKPTEQTTEKTPRKKYVGFTGKILTAMDTHIISKIKENLQELAINKEQNEQKGCARRARRTEGDVTKQIQRTKERGIIGQIGQHRVTPQRLDQRRARRTRFSVLQPQAPCGCRSIP